MDDQNVHVGDEGEALISEVVMPQMGLEVTEGIVAEVLVSVGDEVEEGTPVIVVSTDKADADVMAPASGVVREILVELEQAVAIGEPMIRLADSAEEPLDSVAGPSEQPAAEAAPEPSTAGEATASEAAPVRTAERGDTPRLRAAPVARRAAADLGVALADVEGTGPSGRITLKDVKRHAPSGSTAAEARAAAAPPPGGFEVYPPLRRAIAQRMTASQLIPQYTLTREIDMTACLEAKSRIARERPDAGIGVNDLLIQALAETVVQHPLLAAVYAEEDGQPGIVRRESVNVGLAVASDGGLLVPVVKDVPRLHLGEIAAERRALTGKARNEELRLDELSDGVISLSNLGGFGIDRFTAMVNPGQSAIVAVGRTQDRLTPVLGGTRIVPTLVTTWSFDHRVLDGAVGAAAVATLAELLEGQMQWN